MAQKKTHIREPGSFTQTLCGRDAVPGQTVAFRYTERELDETYETEVCLRCIKANREHLSSAPAPAPPDPDSVKRPDGD